MNLENVDDVYPLSPMQEGMLYHSISAHGSGVYVSQLTCVLSGDLDVRRFAEAFDAIVKRHAILRSVFLWDGLDEPLQVVRSRVEIPWAIHDWRGKTDPQKKTLLRDLFLTDRQAGFDLAKAPLMRMTLIREEDLRYRWIWSCHHVICDGWSAPIVVRELADNYAATQLPRLSRALGSLSYRDYIAWLQRQNLAPAESFWRGMLAGFTSPTQMNITRGEKSNDGLFQQHSRRLSARDSEHLRDFAKKHKLTLNTVVLGAWSLLLSRYAAVDEVVFGVTTSGRTAELTGIDTAVGLFINTLPIRVSLDGHSETADWLAQLQLRFREILKFEYSPLSSIQKWSEVPSAEPLFSSIVVFENLPASLPTLENAGFEVSDIAFHEQSNYPLALLVVPGDQLQLILIRDDSKFDKPTVVRMLEQLEHLLVSFAGAPAARLSTFALVTDAEREQRLNDWTGPVAAAGEKRTLHALIASNAATNPEATAVVDHSEQLTYRQLDGRANQLAWRLVEMGVRPGDRVGLLTERSAEMVVGILGILKAGAAYVPLDPAWPEHRRQLVIDDAEISVVVKSASQVIPGRTAVQTICVGELPEQQDASGEGSSAPQVDVRQGNLAYVIFTSGSTGKPKGVAVTHRNIVHSTLARRDYYSVSPERFLLLSSSAFDSSLVGLFWTLVEGGTLVLPEQHGERDIAHVVQLIAEHQITHTLCLPSLYRLILEEAQIDQLASLRSVIVAGETCPARLCRAHFDRAPAAALLNEYGPTEGTVWSTVHRVTRDDFDGPIPIGRPVSSIRVHVLDQHMQPAPLGVSGEIYLGGEGVARGYLNRPDLTRQQFLADPFSDEPDARLYRTGDLGCLRPDGSLLFLGRVDQQLKIRGYRIEPGEIEQVLLAHPDVAEVAVMARRDWRAQADEDDSTNPGNNAQGLADRLSLLPDRDVERLLSRVEGMSADEIDQLLASPTR